MSDLINKYIYNVSRNLPKKLQVEVKRDLESNIYDMLGDEFNNKDVIEVLNSLGNPKDIADQYRGEARYVISPENFSEYLVSLKITMIIVSILFFFFGAIIILQKTIGKSVLFSVFSVLAGALSLGLFGLILSYAVVTFAFQMLSLKKDVKPKTWDINNLAEVPKEKSFMISKNRLLANLSISLIIGLLGLFILIFYPSINLFGLVFVFNQSIINIFIPLFLVSIIMVVVKSVLMLKMDKINYLSTIYYTVYSIYTGVILILFILAEELFTKEFYQSINLKAFQITTIVLASIIGVLITTSIAIKWYKAVKNYGA